MSHRKKQLEETLTSIGIGTLLAGTTFGFYCFWKSRSQEQAYYTSKKVKKPSFNREACPICFETMTTGTTLKCQHSFHKKCIARWEAISETCPVCRLPLM